MEAGQCGARDDGAQGGDLCGCGRVWRPGVVVSYTSDPDIQTGKRFAAQGMQIAAGVPLQCDEPADFRTFRIGLFGLDKLFDVDGTVARLARVVDQVL